MLGINQQVMVLTYQLGDSITNMLMAGRRSDLLLTVADLTIMVHGSRWHGKLSRNYDGFRLHTDLYSQRHRIRTILRIKYKHTCHTSQRAAAEWMRQSF